MIDDGVATLDHFPGVSRVVTTAVGESKKKKRRLNYGITFWLIFLESLWPVCTAVRSSNWLRS